MQQQTESFYEAMFRAANSYSVQGADNGLMSIFNQEAPAYKRPPQKRRQPRH
jgi:hypothetical protein